MADGLPTLETITKPLGALLGSPEALFNPQPSHNAQDAALAAARDKAAIALAHAEHLRDMARAAHADTAQIDALISQLTGAMTGAASPAAILMLAAGLEVATVAEEGIVQDALEKVEQGNFLAAAQQTQQREKQQVLATANKPKTDDIVVVAKRLPKDADAPPKRDLVSQIVAVTGLRMPKMPKALVALGKRVAADVADRGGAVAHMGGTATTLVIQSVVLGDAHAQLVLKAATDRRQKQAVHKVGTAAEIAAEAVDGAIHFDFNKVVDAGARAIQGVGRNIADETNLRLASFLPELEAKYGHYKMRDATGQEHYLWGFDHGHMRVDELREVLQSHGIKVMVNKDGTLDMKAIEAGIQKVIADTGAYVPLRYALEHDASLSPQALAKLKADLHLNAKDKCAELDQLTHVLQEHGVKDVSEIKGGKDASAENIEAFITAHPLQHPAQNAKAPEHAPATPNIKASGVASAKPVAAHS